MTTGPRRLWLGAILLLTFLVYAPGLGNDYTYDGRHYARGITDDGQPNYMVQEWRGLAEYFRRPMHYRVNPGRGYRPVTVISYAALHSLFKDARGEAPAWPSHLLDVILHVLATWLCYLLLVQLVGAGPPALLATLVFGLHALRSDVVLSIVGRADILGFVLGAAGLLTFLAALGRAGAGRWLFLVSSTVLLFLSYCSKESAVTWAPFLPVFAAARAWQRGEGVAWRQVLSMGLPVVATTQAAQGLGADGRDHLVLADGADATRGAVVELLGNPERARSIGRGAAAFVRSHFRWEDALAILDRIIAELFSGRGAPGR